MYLIPNPQSIQPQSSQRQPQRKTGTTILQSRRVTIRFGSQICPVHEGATYERRAGMKSWSWRVNAARSVQETTTTNSGASLPPKMRTGPLLLGRGVGRFLDLPLQVLSHLHLCRCSPISIRRPSLFLDVPLRPAYFPCRIPFAHILPLPL